jgi:Mn-dependent DtxR family transcriptional regulator
MPARTIESYPLSPRMQQYLAAIERLTAAKGFPPTLHELAAECGIHPTRSHQLTRVLIRRGLVLHEPRSPRTIRLANPASPSRRREPSR